MTLADCVQTINPTAPINCRNCADSTSQPEALNVQGQPSHFPHWNGWVMAKKGNHTLPNLGIMLASKEARDRKATDTEIVGRVGSCTEQEEEPRGLQILHSGNAVEQHNNQWESTVDWSCTLTNSSKPNGVLSLQVTNGGYRQNAKRDSPAPRWAGQNGAPDAGQTRTTSASGHI